MPENKYWNFLLSLPIPLLIVIITAGAYWVTFRYEVGYLSAFGFSPDFAEVSFQTTFLVAFALYGVVGGLVWFSAIVWPDDPAKRRRATPFVFMALGMVWYLLVYEFSTDHLRILLGIVAGCATWWILQSVDEWVTRINENRPERITVMDRLGRLYGREPVFMLAMFFALSGFAELTGRGQAETKADYFILADPPERAVVRVYTDRILAVQFDRSTKAILPNVIIRKVEKDNTLQVEKRLGPLRRPH
jgi:hypothetical protein